MLRNSAPSQVLKRRSANDSDSEYPFQRIKRLSLNVALNDISFKKNDENCSDNENLSHEELITKILLQPFKVPIKNYNGSYLSKSLGIRRSNVRRALHDPFEDNALVLYTPKEMSEHQKLSMKADDIEVHVVVDPLLSKVLRYINQTGLSNYDFFLLLFLFYSDLIKGKALSLCTTVSLVIRLKEVMVVLWQMKWDLARLFNVSLFSGHF